MAGCLDPWGLGLPGMPRYKPLGCQAVLGSLAVANHGILDLYLPFSGSLARCLDKAAFDTLPNTPFLQLRRAQKTKGSCESFSS